MKDILFYSNYCNYCKQFNDNLNKYQDIKNKLHLFCIDNNREKVPTIIKSVPSILTKEKKILTGKDVFNWFEQQQQHQQKEIDDPLAWHNNEMGSAFSDHYSFLEADTAAEGLGGNSIAHSFSFLNSNLNSNISNGGINTPQEKNNNQKDILTKRMESLMEKRDSELPKQVNRI